MHEEPLHLVTYKLRPIFEESLNEDRKPDDSSA